MTDESLPQDGPEIAEKERRSLTVGPREFETGGWTAWVDDNLVGEARSLTEVLLLAGSHGCDPSRIQWRGYAYWEMIESGVAPLKPPYPWDIGRPW
jgi:hypothetical protein